MNQVDIFKGVERRRGAFSFWAGAVASLIALCANAPSMAAENQTAVAPATTAPLASDLDITKLVGQPFHSGQVIPTPKRATYRDEDLVLLDGPKRITFCEPMFEYFGPARDLLMRLFNKRFDRYKALFAGAWKLPDKTQRLPVLFTLASDPNAKYLLDRYGLHETAASLKPQGYLLEIRPAGVLCAGKDNAGLVNGLASFLQLVHVKDGRWVVRGASIVDSPTFTTRYTAEYSLGFADFFDWMMLYKYNGFASCYPAMDWRGLSEGHKKAMAVIKDYIDTYQTMTYMVEFHIGGRRHRAMDCGDPADVEQLLKTVTETLERSGARHIMLCYDDVRPKLQPREKERFKTPADAHGAVADRVYRRVQKIRPGAVVSFCTPYYQGFQHKRWRAGSELREVGLRYLKGTRTWNPNLRIVWTGPVTESLSITQKDIDLYRAEIGPDRPLFYWDNTWHYHQPLRSFYATYVKDFVHQCADRTSYVNINGTKPIGRFFAATAIDYYWNPEGFDSKRSRQQAVAQFMGLPAVAVAERFYRYRGDGYFYHFSRMADLSTFGAILRDLEKVSLNAELPAYCWSAYDQVAKVQKKPPHKPQ